MLLPALRAAAIGLLVHLAASAAPPKEIKIPVGGLGSGASLKLSVKEQPQDVLPPASNPYEGKAYAGCDGGYCAPEDAGLEREFFLAADKGKPKLVKKLLKDEKLNITRNIVPDSEGLTRVIDVAMWAASYRGHYEVLKVRASPAEPPSTAAASGLSETENIVTLLISETMEKKYTAIEPQILPSRLAALLSGCQQHIHGNWPVQLPRLP